LRLCRKVASKPDQEMTKQVEQIHQLLASANKLHQQKSPPAETDGLAGKARRPCAVVGD